MTAFEKLELIQNNNSSILCIGLDSDLKKIPAYLQNDMMGLYNFNCSIIEATSDLVCSYKINFAFYEQYGYQGFDVIKKTLDFIPKECYTIADAKRADIGNSSKAYAEGIFNDFGFDSVTVSPYMGLDSVAPFFDYSQKMVYVLALTSNPGSEDFQQLLIDGEPLYLNVVRKFAAKYQKDNLGFVVGATHPEDLAKIRQVISDNYLLIPGIGTQGGDAKKLLKANNNCNSLINVSRDIIYCNDFDNFAEAARDKSKHYKDLFNKINLEVMVDK